MSTNPIQISEIKYTANGTGYTVHGIRYTAHGERKRESGFSFLGPLALLLAP